MLIPPALQFLFDHRQHLSHKGAVLDFGDQVLFDSNHAASLLPDFKSIGASKNDYEKVSIIYKLLGLGVRKTLDFNLNADFRFNLNYPAIGNLAIDSKFDLVTNQGFSEHVFNQLATFEAIHYA